MKLFYSILNLPGPLGKSSLFLAPRNSVKLINKVRIFYCNFEFCLQSSFQNIYWAKFEKPVEVISDSRFKFSANVNLLARHHTMSQCIMPYEMISR